MTAIADAITEPLAIAAPAWAVPPAEETPTPCTCGGVLVWDSMLGAWEHNGEVCLPCARDGYAYCDDTCPNPAEFCTQAEPVTCEHCSSEVTVEGCVTCPAAPGTDQPDPDHAYDLHRERNW